MKKYLRRAMALALSGIMMLQMGATAFAATPDAPPAGPIDVPAAVEGMDCFFFNQNSYAVSEKSKDKLYIPIGREGDLSQEAEVTLRLVDLTSHYGVNYKAEIYDDDVEGEAKFGQVSIVDLLQDSSTVMEEIPDVTEEDLAQIVQEQGGMDIVNKAGQVIGEVEVRETEAETADQEPETPAEEPKQESAEEPKQEPAEALTETPAEEPTEAPAETPVEEPKAPAQEEQSVEEESGLSLADTNNPLRAGRNQFTGVFSDRQGIADSGAELNLDNQEAETLATEDFPGTDYVLHFGAGQAVKYLVITPKYSAKAEGDSMLMLMLRNPTLGIMLEDNTCVSFVSIQDEDEQETVTVSMAADAVTAQGGKAVIEVTRTGAINNLVAVNIYTQADTAETGKDFSGVNAKLYFPMGVQKRTLELPLSAGGEEEMGFYVRLDNPIGCEIGDKATYVTIPARTGEEDTAELASDYSGYNSAPDNYVMSDALDLSGAAKSGNCTVNGTTAYATGRGEKNNTKNGFYIWVNNQSADNYLWDGIRLKWNQDWCAGWSDGYASCTLWYHDGKGTNQELKYGGGTGTAKFDRTDDIYFNQGLNCNTIDIYTVTTGYSGRMLNVNSIQYLKRDFIFNLAPAATPAEGGLSFLGCDEAEIAQYQSVRLGDSATAKSITVKSLDNFSVTATGEGFARLVGLDAVKADGTTYRIANVSANSSSVNVDVDEATINALGRRGFITWSKGDRKSNDTFSWMGSITIRPVFEYVNVQVDFVENPQVAGGAFKNMDTGRQYHLGDKITLSAANTEAVAGLRPIGFGYEKRRDSSTGDLIKAGDCEKYVRDNQYSFLLDKTYVKLFPAYDDAENNIWVTVSASDRALLDTSYGLFANSVGVYNSASDSYTYQLARDGAIQMDQMMILIVRAKDPSHVPLWTAAKDSEKVYSGETFYYLADSKSSYNKITLKVDTDAGYYRLGGIAQVAEINLATGYTQNQMSPAREAVMVGGTANTTVQDEEGRFTMNGAILGKGGTTFRYLASYNGVTQIKEVLLPRSGETCDTTYLYPNPDYDPEAAGSQYYLTKSVSAIDTDMGIVELENYSTTGLHISKVDVVQDKHVLNRDIQSLEMSGAKTTLMAKVSGDAQYMDDDGNIREEKVQEVVFLFVDGRSGELRSYYPATYNETSQTWEVTFQEFSPKNPDQYTYGDVLYVGMSTNRPMLVDSQGHVQENMAYAPLSTGYCVISDSNYEDMKFNADIPLDAQSLMGAMAPGSASEPDGTKRASYGDFPFMGEIEFFIRTLTVLQALSTGDSADDYLPEDLDSDADDNVSETASLASTSGDAELQSSFWGSMLTKFRKSTNATGEQKATFAVALKIKQTKEGITRFMIGARATMGSSNYTASVNPYKNVGTAYTAFGNFTKNLPFNGPKGKNLDKMHSFLGGKEFHFTLQMGIYADWGYVNVETRHPDGTVTTESVMAFRGGGGYVGGALTASYTKATAISFVPVYIGGKASVNLTTYLGWGKNPNALLEKIETGRELSMADHKLDLDVYLTGYIGAYGGVGVYNALGLRLDMGAGPELGYSRKMEELYPNIGTDFGFQAYAKVSGQLDVVITSIPLASFSIPITTHGFFYYFSWVRRGNRIIEYVNEALREQDFEPQVESKLKSKRDALEKMIDTSRYEPTYTTDQIKEATLDLINFAYAEDAISTFEYIKCCTNATGTVVSISEALSMEEEEDPGFYVRDHVNSQWVAGEEGELMGAFAPVSTATLQTDAFAQPWSQLMNIGNNKLLLVFLDDDRSRSTLQASVLKYAIYDGNTDTWTDPVTIQNDGTADMTPNLCDAGDVVMIAWASAAPGKEARSDDPTTLFDTMEIYSVLFDKQSETLGEIERLTDDHYYDSAPQGIYDEITGDRIVYYIKSAPDTDASFDKVADKLLAYNSPYADGMYSVICYMLYDNSRGDWARDYYYPSEIEATEDYVQKWKGQRFLPSVIDSQTDPAIGDLTVCAGYNGIGVYAYTVDTDMNLKTDADRELYIQFYDFEDHANYVPIRMTDDNIAQSMPRLIRNDNTTYLFWVEDNERLLYLDVSDMLKGYVTGEDADGNLIYSPNVNPDGSFNEEFLPVLMMVDSVNTDEDNKVAGIQGYQVFTDDNDDLYVVWTDSVCDMEAMSADPAVVQDIEIFATARIKEEDIKDKEGNTVTNASWSKPYQLTTSGKMNDGVTAALLDDGSLILVHNQYDKVYKGYDLDYIEENMRVVTRTNPQGEEEQYLEGDFYEMTPVNLMATRLEPVGSLEVREFRFSDKTPMPGDQVVVQAILENNGLTTVRGCSLEFYEYKNGQKGKLVAQLDTDTHITVNTARVFQFKWEVPADLEGMSILCEAKEKNSAMESGYYAAVEAESQTFTFRSDCAVTVDSVTQNGGVFDLVYTVTNSGNRATAQGDTAQIVLSALYGDIKTVYGLEDELLATVDISGIAPGQTKTFTTQLTIPASVFQYCGYDAVSVILRDSENEALAYSEEEFVTLKQPLNFTLNQGERISLNKGGSRTLTSTFDGGDYVDQKINIVYTVEDASVACVDGDRLTGVGVGTTTVTATALPYGITSTVQVTVTGTSDSGSSGGSSGPVSYSVRFESNGGSAVATQSVRENATASKPADPTREGYTFAGWYADKGLTRAYDFSAKVTGSLTLYAKWEKKEAVKWENNFTDVKESDWYYKAVSQVASMGIVTGTSATTYSPAATLNRAMLVTMLNKYAGSPKAEGEQTFSDVKADSWYAQPIQWAAAQGLVSGTGANTFSPEAPVTREQAVTILYQYAKKLGLDVSVGENTNVLSYDDFDQMAEYAIPAIQWACGAGLISGRSATMLAPKGIITRAEIAQILVNFMALADHQ